MIIVLFNPSWYLKGDDPMERKQIAEIIATFNAKTPEQWRPQISILLMLYNFFLTSVA
jgi:hypothetical protein